MWGSQRCVIVTATRLAAWTVLFCALATCSTPGDVGDEGVARVHLAAAAATSAGAAAVRVDVLSCHDSRVMMSARVGLDASERAELGSFGQMPVSLLADHRFGRVQIVIRYGCYRVRAVPVDGRGVAVSECRAANSPPIPMGPSTRHDLIVVPRCSDRPFHVPVVDGYPNFAPVVSSLDVSAGGDVLDAREVCVRARDPEADAVVFEWQARDAAGVPVEFDVSSRPRQVGDQSRECIRLRPEGRRVEVAVVALDGIRRRRGAFTSHEALRAHRHGVVTPSRAARTIRLDPHLP